MTTSLPIRTIVGIVSDYYDVPVGDILAHRRDMTSVRARHVAMYLARNNTHHSLPAIGRIMGDRDHSTVLSAVNKMPERMAEDATLALEVRELEGVIEKATEALSVNTITLKSDIDPYAVACRIVTSTREATTVSLEEMRAVAEALISQVANGLLAKLTEGADDAE